MRRASTEILDEIKRFNDNDTRIATVSFIREYLTLYIDGRAITSGEIEVYERIKQINRENGYQFF
jgi:hypothetical protein